MDRATEAKNLRRRYGALGLLAVGLAGAQALANWRNDHLILINETASLDHWAFLVDRRAVPERGDFAFFVAPQNDLVTRHFGSHAPPFGKRVYGVGGDRVSRNGHVVRVNGRAIARLKPFTKTGEALTPGPVGIIPPGCFYMGSPHRDGLDSRYGEIGFVCRGQLVGTGEAIL
jgi:conjugal transfer pilin signal peptidase TrbI